MFLLKIIYFIDSKYLYFPKEMGMNLGNLIKSNDLFFLRNEGGQENYYINLS